MAVTGGRKTRKNHKFRRNNNNGKLLSVGPTRSVCPGGDIRDVRLICDLVRCGYRCGVALLGLILRFGAEILWSHCLFAQSILVSVVMYAPGPYPFAWPGPRTPPPPPPYPPPRRIRSKWPRPSCGTVPPNFSMCQQSTPGPPWPPSQPPWMGRLGPPPGPPPPPPRNMHPPISGNVMSSALSHIIAIC